MQRYFTRHSRFFAALFFLILTLAGLLVSDGYGVPVDEPSEQEILMENLHEYAVRLQGERSAAARYYAGKGVGLISESIEKDHGECAYYAFAPFLKLQEEHPRALYLAWHAWTWLWFMAGVLALYGIGRESGISRGACCLGCLVLYLCPRFFAEGHYNNKDMVLLSLVLITLYLGYRFLKQPGILRGLLFSLAGAMAANTKIAGLLPWGLTGLAAVILITAEKRWSRSMILTAAVTVISMPLFYALLTPALLSDPKGYMQYLLNNAVGFSRWTGVVLFRGEHIDASRQALPRSYLPRMILYTVPPYTLLLAAAGEISALRGVLKRKCLCRSRESLFAGVITLSWLLPLAACIVLKPLIYNGWRHFYFLFAGIAVSALWGTDALFKTGRAHGPKALAACVLAICIALGCTGAGMIANHPYQYVYFGSPFRAGAETDMELDWWMASTSNALKALISSGRDPSLPLEISARDDMSLLGLERNLSALMPEDRAALTVSEDPGAPYLFSNTTYAEIYGTPAPEGYHELLGLNAYGLRICTVYEKDGGTEK